MDVEDLARAVVASAFGSRPIRRVRPAAGGYSGNVYALEMAEPDATYCLRRHRNGPVAAGAEATIAARLRGTVPVPRGVYADVDGSVCGDPVTLTEWLDGVLLQDLLPSLDQAAAARVGHAVGTILAGIGTVRFATSGFFVSADLDVGRSLAATPVAEQLHAYVSDRLTGTDDPLLADYASLVRREAGALAGLDDPPALVHADFNPKNILVRGGPGGVWEVAAVLDWEFAFAASPLVDVANMLRHSDRLPPGYIEGFVTGFRDAGGRLSEGWEARARLLDVFALVEFLTRDGPLTPAVRKIARRCVDRDWI